MDHLDARIHQFFERCSSVFDFCRREHVGSRNDVRSAEIEIWRIWNGQSKSEFAHGLISSPKLFGVGSFQEQS